MENRVIWFASPKTKIGTKYVFSKGEQVFEKREGQTSNLPESHEDVWYPINFQWIPVLNLSKSLK